MKELSGSDSRQNALATAAGLKVKPQTDRRSTRLGTHHGSTSPGYVPGRFGQAFQFNGNNQRVDIRAGHRHFLALVREGDPAP